MALIYDRIIDHDQRPIPTNTLKFNQLFLKSLKLKIKKERNFLSKLICLFLFVLLYFFFVNFFAVVAVTYCFTT